MGKSKKLETRETPITRSLICDGCGWVHFGVSLQYAMNEVKEFNYYYDKLSKEDQVNFYGGNKSHIKNYTYCFSCGSLFTRMRPLKKTDKGCPDGSTIQPILDPKRVKYE